MALLLLLDGGALADSPNDDVLKAVPSPSIPAGPRPTATATPPGPIATATPTATPTPTPSP